VCSSLVKSNLFAANVWSGGLHVITLVFVYKYSCYSLLEIQKVVTERLQCCYLVMFDIWHSEVINGWNNP
jgi:hypothetical protein